MKWFKVAERVAVIGGVLLCLFALGEIARIYLMLRDLSPWLGWGFLAVAGGLLAAFIIYAIILIRSVPRALRPPELPEDMATAAARQLNAYRRYLERLLRRLRDNSLLNEERVTAVDTSLSTLEAIGPRCDTATLVKELQQAEDEAVRPALAHLRMESEREVRDSVRDVMVGVTVSPYHHVDLIIVLFRNVSMVLRVIRIYQSRPLWVEQLRIGFDILRVVATVNYLNIGKRLIESLFSRVPFVGPVVDDIAQGLGAGLFTSAAGHAAIERCETFRGWDQRLAAQNLANKTRSFLTDVRDIFIKDILPDLKGRPRPAVTPENVVDSPGFWDAITNGVNASVEATGDALDSLIVKPVGKAGRGIGRLFGGGSSG